MAEKIKYIVKCTFCDKDYTVEIEDGEDFSCPTCGGAGSREHASRVKSALESAEIKELQKKKKKHKQKELFGKKRSIASIAKDEEFLDDFRFEKIDRYESHIYACEPRKERSDIEEEDVYVPQHSVSGKTIAYLIDVFIVLSFIIYILITMYGN